MTKIIRCGDVYEKYVFNEMLFEGLNVSIRHGMRKYWKGKKKAYLHDFAFHAKSLILLQEHDITSKRTSPSTSKQKTHRENPWFFHKSDVNVVRRSSSYCLPVSLRETSDTAVIALDTTTQSTPSEAISSLIASLDALSTMDDAAHCRVCLSKNHMTSQISFITKNKRKASRRFRDFNI